jgi:hypothetical protein
LKSHHEKELNRVQKEKCQIEEELKMDVQSRGRETTGERDLVRLGKDIILRARPISKVTHSVINVNLITIDISKSQTQNSQ